jgi:hypothetical protein
MDSGEHELVAHLDPGIRKIVSALRERGGETFESCQGGHGHSYPEPTVRFHGESGAGFIALGVALELGLPVLSLRRVYQIVEGLPTGPWWEMTFRTTDPQR